MIDFREPFPRLRSQGVLHAADGRRMSKSRGNVVTPDEVVERYRADILRLYLLFMAPFDKSVTWSEDGIALLAPLAPHIAEELWAQRGGTYSVHQQPWPACDPALTVQATLTLIVQVNGKLRDRMAHARGPGAT